MASEGMEFIDLCRKVAESKSLLLFKPTTTIGLYELANDMEKWRTIGEHDENERAGRPQGFGKGWVMLDLFTASTFVQVYDLLSKDEYRANIRCMPYDRAISFVWRMVDFMQNGKKENAVQ